MNTLKEQSKIDYPNDLKCKFCGKICKNKNSFVNHERTCPENPNRNYKNGMTGKKGCNQYIKAEKLGLPKPIISDVTRETLSNKAKNRKHSKETKNHLSEIKIKYYKENPDKIPYKLYHYSKGRSYPEQYWKDVFDKYLIKYDEQYQIYLYSLDFAIPDFKIDIEIDGDQHYNDPRIVKSDKRRNTYLENLGWKVIRIKWSDYQKLNRHDKESFVNNVIERINTLMKEY